MYTERDSYWWARALYEHIWKSIGVVVRWPASVYGWTEYQFDDNAKPPADLIAQVIIFFIIIST